MEPGRFINEDAYAQSGTNNNRRQIWERILCKNKDISDIKPAIMKYLNEGLSFKLKFRSVALELFWQNLLIFSLYLNLTLQLVVIGLLLLLFISLKLLHSNEPALNFVVFFLVIFFGAISFSIAESSVRPFPFKESKIQNAEAYGTIDNIELDREF